MIVEPSSSPLSCRAASGLGFGFAAWLSSAGAHATVLALLAAFSVSTPAPDRGTIAVDLVALADAAVPIDTDGPADEPISSVADPAAPTAPMDAATPLQAESPPTPAAPAQASAMPPEPAELIAPAPPVALEVARPTGALAFLTPPRKPSPPPATLQSVPLAPPMTTIESAPPSPSRDAPRANVDPVVAPGAAALAAPGTPGYAGATARDGNPAPIYPDHARRRGLEGRVVLLVTVTAEGRCGDATVIESSRHDALDEAALDAVCRWRFHPARRDGAPVASSLRVPVAFRLTE